MSEQEWDQCRGLGRLSSLAGKGRTPRKYRLFQVACCRQVWHIMTDRRCRRAVEVAELFADDLVSLDDLAVAREAVRARNRNTAGDLARSVAAENPVNTDWIARQISVRRAGPKQWDRAADAAAEAEQARLFRDIIRNPFRRAPVDPYWLAWNDGIIPKLAEGIYDDRTDPAGYLDGVRLAVLADALEEAGCDDADILGHCRGPGPHVRGCWVVDLLLGRT